MKEIIIRRGGDFWEWRFRSESENKYRTTKIPAKPACNKPARCKWCGVMNVGGIKLEFPVQFPLPGLGVPVHVILPAQACHLVAFEYCQQRPNERVTVAWELTEEEILAGKKGFVWPDDIGGREN